MQPAVLQELTQYWQRAILWRWLVLQLPGDRKVVTTVVLLEQRLQPISFTRLKTDWNCSFLLESSFDATESIGIARRNLADPVVHRSVSIQLAALTCDELVRRKSTTSRN